MFGWSCCAFNNIHSIYTLRYHKQKLHPSESIDRGHGNNKWINSYVQSSSFLSSPPDRCGCPPHRRCSVPACRLSADSNQRSRLRSSTRRRRRGRSSAARSARRSARPETSPHRWPASSWSPGDSPGCFGCLQRERLCCKKYPRVKWICCIREEGKERNLPVYSVGDSAFQASIINENVPFGRKRREHGQRFHFIKWKSLAYKRW